MQPCWFDSLWKISYFYFEKYHIFICSGEIPIKTIPCSKCESSDSSIQLFIFFAILWYNSIPISNNLFYFLRVNKFLLFKFVYFRCCCCSSLQNIGKRIIEKVATTKKKKEKNEEQNYHHIHATNDKNKNGFA